MRAAVVPRPGAVEVVTLDDPTPGPGEVVVAVEACGVCGTDLHIRDGEFAPAFPIVPGHEFAGEVVALGAGVRFVGLGDRVAVDPSLPCHACRSCRQGRPNLCRNWAAIGVTAQGGAAEFVAVPQGNCVRLPEGVRTADYALVEPLACAISGIDVLPRRPGEHYLMYGAGTMGVLVARLAMTTGALSVTVVDPRQDRLDRLQRLTGVQHVATSADLADIGADIGADVGADVGADDGWDVVIDCSGALPAITDGLGRVARGGTYLQFGVPPASAQAAISPYRIYNQEITIRGSMSVRNTFQRAADLLAAGFLDPADLITARMPLEDYPAALDRVAAGEGLKTQVLPMSREDVTP